MKGQFVNCPYARKDAWLKHAQTPRKDADVPVGAIRESPLQAHPIAGCAIDATSA